MRQHSSGSEFVTIVAIDGVQQDGVQQNATRQGVRYVMTVGLLGVIFVSSMMLVILAS